MRVTEIYVERLESYDDFSNRKVGLRAILDERENPRDVFLRLARECETLLEIGEIESDIEFVERKKKEYERRKEELKTVLDEFHKIREELGGELRKLLEEVSRVERLVEEKELKLKESILERLRKIKSALLTCDP